jgi:hypothetical protein
MLVVAAPWATADLCQDSAISANAIAAAILMWVLTNWVLKNKGVFLTWLLPQHTNSFDAFQPTWSA